MKYVRVKSYYQDGRFTGCEHAYVGEDQCKTIKRFRDEFPEHEKCTVFAETIDDEDEKWQEWFRVARRCGCVHFF